MLSCLLIPFLLFVYFLIFIVSLRFIILMLLFIVISYVVIFYAYSPLNFSFGVCFYILCFWSNLHSCFYFLLYIPKKKKFVAPLIYLKQATTKLIFYNTKKIDI